MGPTCQHCTESALHAPTSSLKPMMTYAVVSMTPLKATAEDVIKDNDDSVGVSSSITDTEGFHLKMSKKRTRGLLNVSRASSDAIILEHSVVNPGLKVTFVP